jgi:dihydrofolate reductase
MRKVIVTMWVTLDGFVAGPNGEMNWMGETDDEANGPYQDDFVSAADTLLLGRATYESFAGSWPKVPDDPNAPEGLKAYARKLNDMRKIVFSKTLENVEWNNSTLRREVAPAEIMQLKQEPGRNIIIYGSASLVQTLTSLNLIDQYQLLLHPIALGNGKPLFKDHAKLKLVNSTTHPSGVIELYYQPREQQNAQ